MATPTGAAPPETGRHGYQFWPGWLAAPAAVALFLAAVVPLLFTIFLSLTASEDGGYLNRTFAGGGSYVRLVGDPAFWHALRVQLVYLGVSLVLELVIGFAAALALSLRTGFMRAVRGLMLSPVALPTIVVALLATYLIKSDANAIDHLLSRVGLGPTWLDGPVTALLVICALDAWQYAPFVAILLLAGLQTIPEEVQEAARVDGAGALQRLAHITIPMLGPMIVTVALLRVIDAVQVFPTIYVLTGGGPGDATNALNFWGYTVFFQNRDDQYGATVVGVLSLLTVAVVGIVSGVALRQRGGLGR